MRKRKKSGQGDEIPLDMLIEKRRRGRPWKIPRSELLGRAENYRGIFQEVWPRLRGALFAAVTSEDVTRMFEDHAQPYAREFVPRLSTDILTVIREPRFPKRLEAQISFLGDSLAGRPDVEPRTSRDICSKERVRQRAKSPHKIIRKEFYVECSCGYKGPALNNACRKCGAEISFLPEMLLGPHFS